jgi:cation transporter-like permease
MQNTRLNTLVEDSLQRTTQWLRNPWRRLSVLIISLLSGNFLATAVSTIAGQRAEPDILAAAVVVALAEIVSWLTYAARSAPESSRSWLIEVLNGLKLGVLYGLFVQAFTLGS